MTFSEDLHSVAAFLSTYPVLIPSLPYKNRDVCRILSQFGANLTMKGEQL